MSELEQKFQSFLNKHPEIRAAKDLLNIRALARAFMKEEQVKQEIEAVVAMIRRSDIKPIIAHTDKQIFSEIKISTKDEVVILDYEKSKTIVEALKTIVSKIDYDRNETLKVVVGSHTVKIIVDASNSKFVKKELGDNLIKEYRAISETSLLFPSKSIEKQGIVAYVTSQLLLGGINIREILTCTPELIIYFDENQSLKAYEIFKKIKKG